MIIRFTGQDGREWSFRQDDRIGDSSGMGTVFAGRGEDGTRVAIKRVRLYGNNPRDARRREREVEVAEFLAQANDSGLDTGHLVIPVAYRFRDEDLFLVMPLADESLSQALQASRPDLATGIGIVSQVAQGLVQLAAMPLAHRDLKPANVLRYGAVWKITDFGISRILSEATGTYSLAGWKTNEYAAPELWRNQPANTKTDLYALGVLAYEVFAGARPFGGPREDDFRRQHLAEAPPDLPPSVPARVARLVMRLLAKSASERPQGAWAAVEALEACAKGLTAQQQELAEAAFRLEQRRVGDEIAVAARADEAEREDALRRQALADLDGIVADAFDDLRDAIPDARLTGPLTIEIGRLTVVMTTTKPLSLSGEQGQARTILQGVVHAYVEWRSQARQLPEHLVCERGAGDRLTWYVYPSFSTSSRVVMDTGMILKLVRSAMESAAGGGDARSSATR